MDTEREKYEKRIAQTRIIILIVTILGLAVFFYWAAFPLLNIVHYGQFYDYRFASLGWWVLLGKCFPRTPEKPLRGFSGVRGTEVSCSENPPKPASRVLADFRKKDSSNIPFPFSVLSLNLAIYLCTIAMIAEPSSVGRADVHSIVTVIMLAVNILVLVLLLVWYLPAARNTFWSYREPFNDPRYCCVFKDDPNVQGTQCLNTLTCTGGTGPAGTVIKADLTTSTEFTLMWIWTIIFIVFAAANLGLNYIARTSGLVHNSPGPKREGRIFAVVLLFVSAAVFIFWVAVPLANTQHIYGYPLFPIPPSPGPFVSTRSWAQWWMLWLMSLFIIPILLFAAAMTETKQGWLTFLFFWTTLLITIGCFIATIILLGYGIFYCNNIFGLNIYNTPGSICNDPKWCGVYYAQNPDWCANVAGFIPPVSAADLSWNPIFLQNLIFSILFWVFGIIYIFVYYRLVRFGVLYTTKEEE